MTSKGWIIFATLCVAILGGMIFVAQKDKTDVSSVDVSKLQPATEQNGNTLCGRRGRRLTYVRPLFSQGHSRACGNLRCRPRSHKQGFPLSRE